MLTLVLAACGKKATPGGGTSGSPSVLPGAGKIVCEVSDSGGFDGPGGHADADGVDVQQGDQSTPDTAASAEKAGSETGVSDGPGGHADAAGSNVDHQFEGNE